MKVGPLVKFSGSRAAVLQQDPTHVAPQVVTGNRMVNRDAHLLHTGRFCERCGVFVSEVDHQLDEGVPEIDARLEARVFSPESMHEPSDGTLVVEGALPHDNVADPRRPQPWCNRNEFTDLLAAGVVEFESSQTQTTRSHEQAYQTPRAHGTAALRRHPVDAPVRAVASGPRRDPTVVPRHRHRMSRLTPGPHRGERLARVRAVPAGSGRRHEPWVLQVLEISAGRISADERLP